MGNEILIFRTYTCASILRLKTTTIQRKISKSMEYQDKDDTPKPLFQCINLLNSEYLECHHLRSIFGDWADYQLFNYV
jgi:hypothetical protein